MAAVLGGAQSIFTAAFDEALQLPSEFSAELALRTQQIVAHESGIANTVDPLGGSHLVEFLTDRMEAEMRAVMAEIDAYGGVIKAIEEGWLQARIAERALTRKLDVDNRRSIVVGVNAFRRDDEGDAATVPKVDPAETDAILRKFEAVRARRDAAEVERTLARLAETAADDGENLMPALIECCHAYVTVGEMVETLRRRWGDFQEPTGL
jgi:methylmalonyl-CoA mutase N-terminal domain/subunit